MLTKTIADTARLNALLDEALALADALQLPMAAIHIDQAIAQLVKGCQLAMNSATILAEENSKLRAANDRQRRKRQIQRQYIARGGVLQAEEGQRRVTEAQIVVQQGDQEVTPPVRTRAPPMCSKCHVQGHTRTQCRQN